LRPDVAASWQQITFIRIRQQRKVAMIENLLQPQHLLLVLIVGLFVFGPKKLPELGKGLAEGIRNFKRAINDTGGPDKPQTPPV
jgi:sec-independent protein translocase protein TatA